MASDVPSALRTFLEVQSCRAQLYSRFDHGFKAFLQNKQEGVYRALMSELTSAFSDCSRQVMALEALLKECGRAELAAMLREVQESERDKLRLTLSLQALRQAAAFRAFSWLQRPGRATGGAGGGEEEEAQEEEELEALALLDPQAAAEAARSSSAHHCCTHHHHHPQQHPQQQQQQEEGSHADHLGCSHQAQAGEQAGEQAEGAAGEAPQDGLGPGTGSQEAAQGGAGHSGCGCGSAGGGGGGAGAGEPTRREYEAAVREAMQGLDACIRRINDVIGDVRMELEEE